MGVCRDRKRREGEKGGTLSRTLDAITYADCLAVFEGLGVAFADTRVVVVG